MGIQINGQTDTIKAIDGSLTMPGTVTYEDVSRVNVTGIVTAGQGLHVTGGSVGIGTDNPQNPLHLYGSSDILFKIESTDQYAHIDLGDNSSIARITNDGATGTLRLRADKDNAVGGSNIQFEIDGSEKLRITSDGQVHLGNAGHGTTKVGGQEITGQDYSATLKIYDTRANMWGMQMRRDTGTGPNGIFVRAGNTSSNYSLYVCGTNESVTHLACRGDGKVGIGTDAPSTGLHLMGADAYFTMQGSQTDSNAGILFKDSAGTQNSVILYDFDNDYLKFSVSNDTEALRLYSTGMMGHFGGAANNSGNLSNGTLFRITTSTSVPASSSITIRISGLNSGWATLRGGGYSSAGQSMFSVFYHFGGFMTASHTWDVHTVREWISGGTIVTTKNATSWDITITNNSASYTLSVPFTLESSVSTMKLESI